MEIFLSSLVGLAARLLRISTQASVVIGLVLLAQWLFQKKLSPRWRYTLWLLVLVRLLLPVSPESAFSIFNYAQGVKLIARGTGASEVSLTARSDPHAAPSVAAPSASPALPNSGSSHLQKTRLASQPAISAPKEPNRTETSRAAASSSVPSASVAPPSVSDPKSSSLQSEPQAAQPATGAPTQTSADTETRGAGAPGYVARSSSSATLWSWPLALSLLWLSGALFLLTRIIWFPVRLNAQLAQHETATGPAVFEILEQSKRLIGINKVLPIVQSRAVKSPALLGFIRPWLLLPDGMVERFTPQELRFVFLHELAHLKRRDIAVNWLMTILQILHWFNPLVWFAFARMRADRELACDELALSFAKAEENKSYGQAIIKLLEGFTRPAVLPGLVGILEDKQQMKRRITMIAQFKPMTQWSAVALTLLLTLGLMTLTDAQSGKGTAEQTANSNRRVSAKAQIQVWACPAEVVPSSTSSDGHYLSYIDWNTGNIAVRDLVAGVSRDLTKGSWSLGEIGDVPAVSPDGKDVAYEWLNKEKTYELRIIGLDGAIPRVFYHNTEVTYYSSLAWSPDKKFIVTTFYRKDGTHQLALVSPQDRSARILKSFDWRSPEHPSFSPDGRWILYSFQTKEDVKQNDIFLLATDGSREIPLVQGPANDVSPIWAPDGKNVLFVSDRGGSKGLWLIGVNDGQPQGTPQLVKSDVGSIDPLGVTEKGSFYYFMLVGQNDVYTTDCDLTTGRLASTPQLVSQRFVGFNSVPVWSPDGESLAYIVKASGNSSIVIRSFKTDDERELPTTISFGFELAWSPDGRMLLVSGSDGKGRRGIYQIDVKTGKTNLVVQQATTSSEGHIHYGWFPDTKSIFYAHPKPENKHIQILRKYLEKEQEEEVFTYNYEQLDLRFAKLSPDGRQFAAWAIDRKNKKQEILLIPTDKSKSRELLRVEDAVSEQTIGQTPPGLAWTSDGKHVVFGKRVDRDKSTELWRVNIERGKPEKIGTVTNRVHGIVVHPNGNRIAYSTREDKLEVWVMQNFLPKERLAAASETKAEAEGKSQPIVKTLLSGTNQEAFGVLSPDESKIAYTDWSKVSGDLTVKDLITGEIAKLTGHDTNRTAYAYELAYNQVWSPDSKSIAYWFDDGTTNYSVRIAPAGGGPSKILKSSPIMSYSPFDLSVDGKSLLCEMLNLGDGSLALGILSIESGEVRQLISFGWNVVGHARFSPDGKFIAYDRKENGNRDIYVLALEGMRVTRLTDLPSDEGSPVWSGDGKFVLFSSDRSGVPDLWAVEVRNGEMVESPFLVKQGFGVQDQDDPGVPQYRTTRSGKLAFTRARHQRDCYYFDLNTATGETIGPPKLITKSFYGQHYNPVYSPDGKKIAYIRHRNPLCIQSTADGKEEVFDVDMQYFWQLFWSPDSKSVALLGRGKSDLGIYRFTPETRELTQIVKGNSGYPKGFSADGKEFLFSKGDERSEQWPYQSENVAVEIATRKERKIELPKHFEGVEDYAFSPDGKRIVYSEKDQDSTEQKLIVSDANLTNQKTLAHAKASILKPSWSPDGKMIGYYYQEKIGTEERGAELRVIAADGTWQKASPSPKGKLKITTRRPPSWSSDGTKLALTLSEPAISEIGVLENVLPKEKLAAK